MSQSASLPSRHETILGSSGGGCGGVQGACTAQAQRWLSGGNGQSMVSSFFTDIEDDLARLDPEASKKENGAAVKAINKKLSELYLSVMDDASLRMEVFQELRGQFEERLGQLGVEGGLKGSVDGMWSLKLR